MLKKNKNKGGFTLVELLVVMAIIAILAAIVVPNLATWIGRGRVTRAISEIESIELALSAMLADVERSSLNELFDKDKMKIVLDDAQNLTSFDTLITSLFGTAYDPNNWTHRMEVSKAIYTNSSYALLIAGRGVLERDTNGVPFGKGFDTSLGIGYSQVLDDNLVKKLGTNYLPDIQFDPWGKLYNIFPGPWKVSGRNIFRRYLDVAGTSGLPGTSSTGGGSNDSITFSQGVLDPDSGTTDVIGFEANRRKPFYIWSSGANQVSGQAIYDSPVGGQVPYANTDKTTYYLPQEPHMMGGGDDINNWDSGSSWQRFYN